MRSDGMVMVATFIFFPEIKGWPQIPTHRSGVDMEPKTLFVCGTILSSELQYAEVPLAI